MAPSDHRRPYKRPTVSDQQRRRDLSLHRQSQDRLYRQNRARCVASSVISLGSPVPELELGPQSEDSRLEAAEEEIDVRKSWKLREADARKWFARQLMLPEWMIDVPDRLSQDWFVIARPSGKRCFVVSHNGVTVSRLRNGSILHRFPSSLPWESRSRDCGSSSQSYTMLDCIFHELDQTYYVIDMLYGKNHSLYDCTADFRFSWLNSMFEETRDYELPSGSYRFSTVPVYNCDQTGLQEAYAATFPYIKDGLLFFNKHANYQTGNTPLALVWKDENCSQYVIDTDSQGNIPSQQHVVLELQDDGNVTTSDDPPVPLGLLDPDFISKSGLRPGNLVRFTISINGLIFDKPNRARAFADSYSKILFQQNARNSPLRIQDILVSSMGSSSSMGSDEYRPHDVEMVIG